MPNEQADRDAFRPTPNAQVARIMAEAARLGEKAPRPWLPVLVVLVPAVAGFLGIVAAIVFLVIAPHGGGAGK